jgi:Protein of unknown function (DUF1194)/Virulence factor BrkB
MRWIKLPYHAAWRLVMVDEGLELSGYIAFTAFLSLFPFVIFLAALAGFLGDRETADAFIDAMFEFMPADVAKTLAPAVREVVGARQGGLLTFGILATLWFASNGFEALRTGLNRAYGVAEQRAMLVAAPAEHRIRDRWRPTHSLPLAGGHPRPAGLERARSRRGSRTRDAPDVRHGALFVRRRAAVRRAHLAPSLAAQHEAGVCAHFARRRRDHGAVADPGPACSPGTSATWPIMRSTTAASAGRGSDRFCPCRAGAAIPRQPGKRVAPMPRFPSRVPLVIAGALVLTPVPATAALVDWLVLLVDASGSIDAYEYRLQHEAYVTVLRDPEIGLLLDGAQVAIVEFAELPELIVDWSADPAKAASAYAAHSRRVAWPGPASTTGIARALGLALDMLEDKPGRKVIDISGDGADNVDWVAAVWSQRERARELLIEINGLAIPTAEDPDVDRYYAENVINGFLEVSREHVAFERTLRMKMHIEIAGAVETAGDLR